jgi:hypothetical protein
MLKKLFIIIVLLSLLCLATPVLASSGMGQSLNKTAEQVGINQYQNLTVLIAGIVQSLLGLLGVIFVVLLIYGGVIWMTSMADPKKIEKAKSIIKASIIGLLIIVSAYSIAYFITSRLENATTTRSNSLIIS